MTDPTPVQRFMARVARMAALRQNDIRLSLAEAAELSACLAGLLAAPTPQRDEPAAMVASPAAIDGGGLKRP